MNIIQKPSPNFAPGRGGFKPELVVIHIMDGTLSGTDSWFASPISQVSAHYGIGDKGEIHQYVKEEDTAWHAGVEMNPTFKLRKPGVNANKYTIGIEHEGKADTTWSVEMMKASAALIREICTRWNIPMDRDHIIGHYEICTPRRANCPAVNKWIIDRLIALAKPLPENPKVAQAIKLLDEATKLLKEI